MRHTDGMSSIQDCPRYSNMPGLENEGKSTRVVTNPPRQAGYEIVTTDPAQARDAFERGTALKKAGLFKQAAAHFGQASQNVSYTVKGLAQMGLCFKISGDKDAAVVAFRRAVQAASGSQQEQVPILYLLGKNLESLDHTTDAIETYRWIRRADPGYRDVADRIERLSSRRAGTRPRPSPAISSGSWTGEFFKTWHGLFRSHP